MHTLKNLFALLCIATCASGLHAGTPSSDVQAINKATQRLLLISIDGYRHDYTDLHQPPFLTDFRQQGASLVSLRPAFPSLTFPNHLTLVTGMRPARHGIVFNSFYAPDLGLEYTKSQPASVLNPDFYLAPPLWVLLERAGIKTATYFWPGSEAAIGGHTPSTYLRFNKATPVRARIDTVLEWIAQTGPEAPRFMTLYFSQVDDAGHDFGPTHPKTRAAVHALDAELARLWQQAQTLDPELNLVIVSDHGMYARVDGQQEPLFTKATEHLKAHYRYLGFGPTAQLYRAHNHNRNLQADAELLNRHGQHRTCYTQASAPAALDLGVQGRMGDIVCVARARWNIALPGKDRFPAGNHGWPPFEAEEPAAKDLHAIFYARGPAFKAGVVHSTQDNAHVMPLLAKIVGIEVPADLDGQLSAMSELLAAP